MVYGFNSKRGKHSKCTWVFQKSQLNSFSQCDSKIKNSSKLSSYSCFQFCRLFNQHMPILYCSCSANPMTNIHQAHNTNTLILPDVNTMNNDTKAKVPTTKRRAAACQPGCLQSCNFILSQNAHTFCAHPFTQTPALLGVPPQRRHTGNDAFAPGVCRFFMSFLPSVFFLPSKCINTCVECLD